jgi:DNA-binding PucR family transcriptional regulator
VNEIQILVDSLAQRLQRPVGVDDRRFRAIAYSSHAHEIDSVRRTSILGRQAPDAVTRWLESLGLMQARDVVHVPANPEFEMVRRVSIPVRFHDRLLGFLWLVEDEAPLTPDELELCRRVVDELAQELYRERQQTNEERRLEAAWVRHALDGAPAAAGPGIAPDALYAVLVVHVHPAAPAVAAAGIDVRLTEAVDQLRRGIGPRHQMVVVEDRGARVVLSAGGAAEIRRHAAGLLTAAEAELADVDGASVVVGVSDLLESIDALPAAAAQARRAAQLGQSMPDLGRLVLWSDLGVMRLLGELVGDRDPATLIPAPVRRLLADPDASSLVRTLEAYLEHAGDVAAAAAELYVHRSSLYNRLRRIEEVAGVDIRSGADRLDLHLGIRLWRMGGAPGLA